MRALLVVPLLVLPLLALALAAPATASMRCGNQLVGVGDTALQLSAACGAPGHVARRTVITPGETKGTQIIEAVETWVYPGDQTTFTRLVEVRRGLVTTIATSGYGLPVHRCDSPSVGTTLGELELACGGAPADRSTWAEERVDRHGRLRRLVQHERWIMSPGPGRLLRILEFEDGRLTEVRTGSRAP